MAHSRIIMTTLAVVAIWGATPALAESGTRWERNNIISRHKAFVVIKPDKGACYVKQSNAGDPNKMELTFDGTAPIIFSPSERGIAGNVRYWVDNGPKRTVPASKIRELNTVVLAADAVGRMKAGRTLYVHVTPAGKSPRTQKFSLMGFTAATRVLAGPKCHLDESAPFPPNLEVKLARISGGGVVVSGSTLLPDGMALRVSLQTDINGYYAQETVQVHSGSYESAAFTDRGRALPPGRYTVSISSPLMYLHPLHVQRELGASGSDIPKDIRQKSSYDDSYTVSYSVSRHLD